MRIPHKLKVGDRIGLVCTARKITLAEIEPAVQTLRTWGFEPVIGKSVGRQSHQFAGTDAERAADLQEMLDDPSIAAIIACRGGYGTMRILDLLDFTEFMTHPKWIIGYSDLTVLHAHLNTAMGMATLHASMPVNFATNSPEALQSIRNMLCGDGNSYKWGPNNLNRTGEATAEVVGGNLSLIYSMLGTRTGIHTAHKILFLEDLDEYLYHIDRMMVSLKRAGKLENLAGLMVGSLSDMKDNEVPFGKTAQEIIAEHVADQSYPVCFDFPAGHNPDNRAIGMGVKGRLVVREEGCLFEQRVGV